MGAPDWLAVHDVRGTTDGHSCLHVEDQIYVYWLEGYFKRSHLDDLTLFVRNTPGFRRPYVSIVFTDNIAGYDPDLRTVMTDPGALRAVAAHESVVVSERPLERMIIRTMSMAGRAVGDPGGKLSAASSFGEALRQARLSLAAARAAKAV